MPQTSVYKERVHKEVLDTTQVLRDFGIAEVKSEAGLLQVLRSLRDAGRLDELKALLQARRVAITASVGETVTLGGSDEKSRYFEGEVSGDLPHGVGRIIEDGKVAADGEFLGGHLRRGISYTYDKDALRLTTIVEEAYPNGRIKSGSIIHEKDGMRLSSEAFHEDGTTNAGELIDNATGFVLKEGAFVAHEKQLLLSSGRIEHYPNKKAVHIGSQSINITRTQASSYRLEKHDDTYSEVPEGTGEVTDQKGRVYEIHFAKDADYTAEGVVKVFTTEKERTLVQILNREVPFVSTPLDKETLKKDLAELRTDKGDSTLLQENLKKARENEHNAHARFNNEIIPFIQKNYVDAGAGDLQAKLKIGHYATKLNAKITSFKKQATGETKKDSLKNALDAIRYNVLTSHASEVLQTLLAEYCVIEDGKGGFITDSNKDAFLAAYQANMEARLQTLRSDIDEVAEIFLDEKKAKELTSEKLKVWLNDLGEAKKFAFTVAHVDFQLDTHFNVDGSLTVSHQDCEMVITEDDNLLHATSKIQEKETHTARSKSEESLKLLILGFKSEMEKREQRKAVEVAIAEAISDHKWPCWDEKTQAPAAPTKLDADTGKNFDTANRRVLSGLDFSIGRDTYFEIYSDWFDAHIEEYESSKKDSTEDVHKRDRDKRLRMIHLLEKDSLTEVETTELTELLDYLKNEVSGNLDLMAALEFSSESLEKQIQKVQQKLGIPVEHQAPKPSQTTTETAKERFDTDLADLKKEIEDMKAILAKGELGDADADTLEDLRESVVFTLERLEKVDPTVFGQLNTNKEALWKELKLDPNDANDITVHHQAPKPSQTTTETARESFDADLEEVKKEIETMKAILAKDELGDTDEITLEDLEEIIVHTLERLEKVDPNVFEQLGTTKEALWEELEIDPGDTSEEDKPHENQFSPLSGSTEPVGEEKKERTSPYTKYTAKEISDAIHRAKELALLLTQTDEDLEDKDMESFPNFEQDLVAILYLSSNRSERKNEILAALHGVFDNPSQFFESLNAIEDIIAEEQRIQAEENPISKEERDLAVKILNILNKKDDLSLSTLEKRAYYCAICILEERDDKFLRVYKDTVTDDPSLSTTIEGQRMEALSGHKDIPADITAQKINEVLSSYYYSRINEQVERKKHHEATRGRNYPKRIENIASSKAVDTMDDTERAVLESDINILLLTRGKSDYKKEKQKVITDSLGGHFENYDALLEAIYKKNLELVLYKKDHSVALSPDDYALVRALIDANNEEEEREDRRHEGEKRLLPVKHSLYRIDSDIHKIRDILRGTGVKWLRITLGEPLRTQEGRNGMVTLPEQTQTRIAKLKEKYPELCHDADGNVIPDLELTEQLQTLLEDYYYFEIKTNRANLEERKENVLEHKAFAEMSTQEHRRFLNNLIFFGTPHIQRKRLIMEIFGLDEKDYTEFLLQIRKIDDEYTRFKIQNAQEPTQEELNRAQAIRNGNKLETPLEQKLNERKQHRRNRRPIPENLLLTGEEHTLIRLSLHEQEDQFHEIKGRLLSKNDSLLYALEPVLRKSGTITEDRIKAAIQAYKGTENVSQLPYQAWNDAYAKYFYWRLKQAQEQRVKAESDRKNRVATGNKIRSQKGTSDTALAAQLGDLFTGVLRGVDLKRAQYSSEKVNAILMGHSPALAENVKARTGATFDSEYLSKHLSKITLQELDKIVSDSKYTEVFGNLSLVIVLVEPGFVAQDNLDLDAESEEIDLDLSVPNALRGLRNALEEMIQEQRESFAEEKINAYILESLANWNIEGDPGETNPEKIFMVQGDKRTSAADFAADTYSDFSDEFLREKFGEDIDILKITETFLSILARTLAESEDGEGEHDDADHDTE